MRLKTQTLTIHVEKQYNIHVGITKYPEMKIHNIGQNG